MKKQVLASLLSTTILIAPQLTIAEGYQVNLQHTKNTGMGHTGTGFYGGPSAIHFNPGALGMLDSKFEVSVGGSLLFGSNSFQSVNSTYKAKTENPIGTPFYMYIAGQLMPKLTVGMGVNTPFGNSLKWEDNWAGRYLIQDITMRSITLLPTLSYRLNDMFSIGAGALVGINSVELTKALPLEGSSGEGTINLSGKTNSFGYNIGIYAKFNEKLSAGISYRSKMDVKLDGGDVKIIVPNSLTSLFPANAKFNGELPFPSNINFGVAYKPSDKMLIAVDCHFVGWEAYDSLNFNFEPNTAALQDSHNPRKYKNAYIFRIGAEYNVNNELVARCGFYFDQTPIQDDFYSPETPGANKLGFTGGVSLSPFDNFSVDFALLYIYGIERESYYTPDNFGGKYKTTAFVPCIGVNYKF